MQQHAIDRELERRAIWRNRDDRGYTWDVWENALGVWRGVASWRAHECDDFDVSLCVAVSGASREDAEQLLLEHIRSRTMLALEERSVGALGGEPTATRPRLSSADAVPLAAEDEAGLSLGAAT